jgi:enamine deaminase RidA (YjgF/YER057c/UK114 family)
MKRFLKAPGVFSISPGQPHGLAHGYVFKRLLIGAQVGVDSEGSAPDGLQPQLELAFDNLLAVLASAQLGPDDLIKITIYTVVPGSLQLCHLVREQKIAGMTPVSTYVEIAGLGDPKWLVSVEGEAVREAAS